MASRCFSTRGSLLVQAYRQLGNARSHPAARVSHARQLCIGYAHKRGQYSPLQTQQRNGRWFMTQKVALKAGGDGGGSGNNITAELINLMQEKISAELETNQVEVIDYAGDAKHVGIKVVSKLFEDKSVVNRQRMVYRAIWMELQDQVHAVQQMVTQTPEEAANDPQ